MTPQLIPNFPEKYSNFEKQAFCTERPSFQPQLQYFMKVAKLFGRSVNYGYSAIKEEISFTPAFKTALVGKLQVKDKEQFLRLEISSGEGCEGYSYKFRFDRTLNNEDYVLQSENSKVLFAINEEDFRLIRGSTLDFATEMMRQTFYVKENPNAELSCSCKTSFSPKDHVL